MNSDWLESFLVFSEVLNFTRAAEQLHISQPALHVKLSKLSEFIGKPLYKKQGRNLLLTKEGEQLQAYAREQAEHAKSFIQKLQTGQSTSLVCLSAGEGACQYLLGDAVSHFIKRSASKIQLIIGNRDNTIEAIQSGKAHLGVAVIDHAPDGLHTEKLTQVGQVLVMQKSHRLAKKSIIKFTDLSGEALIVPPKGKPHRVMIDRLLMDSQVEWKPAVEVDGWGLMLNFVSLGLGLSIVNACCHIPKTLVAIPLKGFPQIQYCIIQREQAASYLAVDELKGLLMKYKDSWKV